MCAYIYESINLSIIYVYINLCDAYTHIDNDMYENTVNLKKESKCVSELKFSLDSDKI